jgi:predicted Zn-ribbon and HTH transcriptional regulator
MTKVPWNRCRDCGWTIEPTKKKEKAFCAECKKRRKTLTTR